MIIEKKQIADLIPAPYNPRQSTAKQEKHLKESLEKFGMVEPIIFNKQTGYIVGGHFRVRELKKLGIKEIECVIVDLNEADEKELNIRLNANTGSWDWDTLANDWEVVDLEAWGLEIPQFDNEAEELEASEDDYEVPEGGMETDIVIGDLFEIGEHRLLCGDSTDSDAVARLMNGEKADSLLTDPPYGISVDKNMHKQSGKKYGNAAAPKRFYENSDWDDKPIDKSQIDFIISYASECIIWGGNYFELPPSRCWLVWDKENGLNQFADCELAWTNLDKPVRLLRHLWNGMLRKDKEQRNSHPTQKPIGVISWCINHLSNGLLILDPYLGSGSTMVAAHQLKRRCYGMELEPKYCQVIIDRMAKLDPSLKITRNGKEYKTGLKQGK